MKTMTCRDLGGPCEHMHSGATADDIIKAQDKHLRILVKDGDEAHVPARNAMKRRWLRPRQAMGWYNDVKARYAALPES